MAKKKIIPEKKTTEKKPEKKKSGGKGTEGFTAAIQKHLDEYAKQDKLFATSLKKEKKNIDDCVTYILNYVKKSKQQGYADEEIFKLARHYYDEDELDPGKPVTIQDIRYNKSVEPDDKMREEAIKEARERLIKEEMGKRTKKKGKLRNIGTAESKEKEKEPEQEQTSLF